MSEATKDARFWYSPSRGRVTWREPDELRYPLTEPNDWRPLVVIDAEDREAVERLLSAYLEHGWTRTPDDAPIRTTGIDYLQAALREYANPKPPKPDEPQGLGAVVEDEDGVLWTRVEPFVASNSVNTVAWRSRVPQKDPKEFSWPNIAAVRVLSPGVAVDQ